MSVLFLPEVRMYFEDLETILYEKGYFGFEESSHKYVDELFYAIQDNLSTCVHKPAPPYFDRYGKNMHYAAFRKNKETMWYVFFTKYQDKNKEIIYLVRYIANNHVIAQYL